MRHFTRLAWIFFGWLVTHDDVTVFCSVCAIKRSIRTGLQERKKRAAFSSTESKGHTAAAETLPPPSSVSLIYILIKMRAGNQDLLLVALPWTVLRWLDPLFSWQFAGKLVHNNPSTVGDIVNGEIRGGITKGQHEDESRSDVIRLK